MTAALTLFVVLTLSVMVVRSGAVALRLTGLPEEIARFQARSAFTGTGFTTSESETILKHPTRRKIVSILMVVGGVGLVSVIATVIVSLVGSSRSEGALLTQLLWLAAVLLLLWGVALNPRADRIMCAAIGRILRKSQALAAVGPELLLQCPDGHGVYRIRAQTSARLEELLPPGAIPLALQRTDGAVLQQPAGDASLTAEDEIIAYGPDRLLAARPESH